MPALLFGLLVIGVGAWAFSEATRNPLGRSADSSWAASRRRTSPTGASAETVCSQTADAVSLDSADLTAWIECEGRTVRDLRVLSARLERAATDETRDTTRRTRLIDAHVSLMDWISRREREARA